MPEISYIYHDNFLSFMTLHIIYKGRCGGGYVLEKKKTKYFPSCVYVSVCVRMHTFVCVCMKVNICVHICGAKGQYQVVLSHYSLLVFVIIAVFLLLFETGPLIFTWSALICLAFLSSEPQESICSCFFRAIIMSLCYHIHLFLFGFLGSNSGLHAGTEITF